MTALSFKTEMQFSYGVPRQLAPGVARIVANNPSVFTYKGTNTYLIGSETLAIVDPGPDDPEHHAAILETVAGRPVSHIFITHTHRDHTDGLERLADVTGATVCGYGRRALHPGDPRRSPSGQEFIEIDFDPELRMAHGDVVAGDGWTMRALFTPGHAPDHLCFALEGLGVLFSGDHVMAWNTTVVAPPEGQMADYLASLELLIHREDRIYLPGHGGQIEDPQRVTKAYLVHRKWREQAILGAIRDGHANIDAVVGLVYQGLDPRLVNAARLSVQAHVEHLIARGLVNPQSDGRIDFATPLSAAT